VAAPLAVVDLKTLSPARRAIVAIVCLAAGVALVRFAPAAAGSWRARRQALELESIRTIADTAGFPALEITLRNPAPSTSFLATLHLQVTTRLRRVRTGGCSGRPAGWDYDLLVDGTHTAERDSVSLSQLVDPESRHRFVIVVGQRDPPAHGEYDVALTLRYNEGSTLPLGQVRLAIDGPACGLEPGVRPVGRRPVERTRLPGT
jgi:hypothetical protein